MELAGRVAVVTGGASGIGAACVEQLRDAGAQPVVWDVAPAADVVCDVADPAAIDRAIAWTREHAGAPSLLVAAAGLSLLGPIADFDVSDWDLTFDVNVRGAFLSVQAVTREIIAHGPDGSMVLISSNSGELADPLLSCYGASKAAVIHFARNAAVELGRHGIRVNAVGPGPTASGKLAVRFMDVPGYVESVAEATPLGRLARPEDIAEAAVGLMRMGWVTGQSLMVDGGASLATPRGLWRERRWRERHEGASGPDSDVPSV